MGRDNSEPTGVYPGEIYKEIVHSPLTRFITAIMLALTAFFLHQLLKELFGERSDLTWYFLLMSLVFALVTYFMFNIRKLTISIGTQRIIIALGIFKYTVDWGNIEGYYLDKSSGVRYGGWGIRITKLSGRWTLAYNITTGSRVVLQLRNGRFRQFVFSTNRPELIINIIKQHTGKEAGMFG